MKNLLMTALFLSVGLGAFCQTTTITIKATAPCRVYLVVDTVDLPESGRPDAEQDQYQPPDAVNNANPKVFEEERALGTTPVRVDLPQGQHEFRIVTDHDTVTLHVLAAGRPQTWRVNVPVQAVKEIAGWGGLTGVVGIAAFSGPSYIENERHETGAGSIGLLASLVCLAGSCVAGLLDTPAIVREE